MIARLRTLVAHELRRRIRNRSALITAFVAPLAVAGVFGLLLGGTASSNFELGVVDNGGTASSADLTAALINPDDAGDEVVEFTEFDSRAEAEQAVDDGDVDAALVINSGLDAGSAALGEAAITVLRSPDRVISGQVATAVASSISSRARTVELAVKTLVALTNAPPDPELIAAAGAVAPVISMERAAAGDAIDAQAFYGAAMATLFLFFTVGLAGKSMLAERRDGTLSRVLASPASASEVLAGKTVAVGLLALAGFIVVWLATSVVFDAHWGNPVGVVLVIVATVTALAGVTTFIAGVSHTEAQADATTAAVTFGFALLGGNFVGPDAPPMLERLSLFTPNGWALRAFSDLSADPVGVDAVVGPIAMLLLIGLAFGTLGSWRLHRRFGG